MSPFSSITWWHVMLVTPACSLVESRTSTSSEISAIAWLLYDIPKSGCDDLPALKHDLQDTFTTRAKTCALFGQVTWEMSAAEVSAISGNNMCNGLRDRGGVHEASFWSVLYGLGILSKILLYFIQLLAHIREGGLNDDKASRVSSCKTVSKIALN